MNRRQRHDEEHDRLNQPGWQGYRPSTSQFAEKVHPKFVRNEREIQSAAGAKVTVYFIRFTSIAVPSYSFLKIGISSMQGIRFDFDSHRFTHQTLAQVRGLTRARAVAIECGLLEKFKAYKHEPKMELLSKGNSECFEDGVELAEKITAEFIALNGSKVRPVPEVDLRIHNLMLLLDFSGCLIRNGAGGITGRNEFELDRILLSFRGNLKGLGVRVPSKEDIKDHFSRKIRPKLA